MDLYFQLKKMGGEQMTSEQKEAYWRENLKLIFVLIGVWAFVSFGCSVLFVDWLDQFQFLGFKLGFWMAQQGAIFTFVILIFVYIFQMKKIDNKYKLDS